MEKLTQEYAMSTFWWKVAACFFSDYTNILTAHQVESCNNFMSENLKTILTKYSIEYKKTTEKDEKTDTFKIQFSNVNIASPTNRDLNGNNISVTPQECRIKNTNYMCKVFVDITTISLRDKKEVGRKTQTMLLGSIPCMVKSVFCALHNKNEKKCIKAGECALDPGGYFIINGIEKVLMSQDRMSHNEIFVFKGKSKNVLRVPSSNGKNHNFQTAWYAEVRSHSNAVEPNLSMTSVKLSAKQLDKRDEGRLFVEIPNINIAIPWGLFYMAMGVINVDEMIKYVCSTDDKEMIDLLKPSLDLLTNTQEEAVGYIAKYGATSVDPIKQIKNIIKDKLFQNLSKMYMKKIYLGYMTNRLLSTVLGRRQQDDRDHYGKKRVETTGPLMNNLIKSIWKRIIKETKIALEQKRNNDAAQLLSSKFTNYILLPFKTGNWIATKTAPKMAKVGISQILNRHNYISMLSSLRRIVTPNDKNSRIIKPRHYAGSQFLYICPAETPEGPSTGLIKNMGLLTGISVGSSATAILDWLTLYKVCIITKKTNIQDIQSKTKIFLNGTWIASIDNAEELAVYLRRKRRLGKIFYQVSISICKDGLKIYTDEGRLLVPMFICTKGQIKKIPEAFTLHSLIRSGIIEYLDPNELETMYYSVYPWAIEEEHTHSVIHPCFMLGISASTIPFPEHNQSPRNVYQCLWEEEPVLMADETKKSIKDIVIGDKIITFNPNTFETMTTTVINTYTSDTTKKMLKVTTISGRTITVTYDHKMMTLRGWVEAGSLESNDSLAIFEPRGQNIEYLFIKKRNILISHLKRNKKILFVPIESVIEVDNVRIGDITTASKTHCFIGGQNFCVHNSAMGKQALGMSSTFNIRYDTSSHVLYYPQVPLVNTIPMKLVKSEQLPSGQNLIVAIKCAGYNQEDSVVINRGSLDRGLLRSINYTGYFDAYYKKGTTVEDFKNPQNLKVRETRITGYNNLDDDGLCKPGTPISKRDVVIGKIRNNSKYTKDISVIVKPNGLKENVIVEHDTPDGKEYIVSKDISFVDETIISIGDDGNRIVKTRLRQSRIPQIGDKVASRSAQKGIIGMISLPEDMPFSEKTGMTPDLIMNPNAIPSRMTISQMLESIIGKVAANRGIFINGTAFEQDFRDENGSFPLKTINNELEELGFLPMGEEILINGETGEKIPCSIFMNPTYYQRLKHMVDDKMHARDQNGPRETLTRQPVEGRKNGGGFRVGEMETWCCASHGASQLLKDRLVVSSDCYEMYVCDYCGNTAIAKVRNSSFECKICGQEEHISKIKIPYAFKLLMQELQAIGIGVWINTDNTTGDIPR